MYAIHHWIPACAGMTEGRYFSLGGLFQTGPPQAGMPHALCPSKCKHAGAGQAFNEGVDNNGGSSEDLRLSVEPHQVILV